MNFLRKILILWRRQKEARAFATAYHVGERARTDLLVQGGRGREGVQDNLGLLGIDVNRAERPRLITIGGSRL